MQEENDKRVIRILEKIKKVREAKGYSQEYLAYCLKVKQSTYQKIESGKLSLRLPYLLSIISVLEIEPDQIIQT